MSTRAADDFGEIRRRMIEIAGPAGNPTQPTGDSTSDGAPSTPAAMCANMGHIIGLTGYCARCGFHPTTRPEPAWDYCC